MTVWRYSLFLWLYLAQLESEHPWLETSLAPAALTLSKKGMLLQDAFGGKITVSVELSPLSPSQSSSSTKGKAPWAVLQRTIQGAQRTKTPTTEGGLLSHSQHFALCSAAVLERQPRAKSLAGRNVVVVPNTTARHLQPCWEFRLGSKWRWGLKNQFQRRVKAGEQLAHQGQFWVKKPKPKKLLCTENAHIQPRQHPYQC